MTDSHPAPDAATNAQQPGYEGFDPDLPDSRDGSHDGSKRRLDVSTVQVGASAAAAVTSAFAASFAGVGGTLIGAAVGSIVSTVAGALYADYLRRAGKRIRTTKTVVVQRIPGEVLAATPLRHLTGPADLPGKESLQPIGPESEAAGDGPSHEPDEETFAVPVSSANEILAKPDPTSGIPAESSSSQSSGEVGGSIEQPRPWWKRRAVTMTAVGAAGFLIAIGALTVSELVLGHPASGGTSGTSLSKVISGDIGKATKTEVTPTPSATTTPSVTSSSTTEATAPETTTAPAATETTAPTATSTPQTSSSAGSAAAASVAPTQADGSQTSPEALGVLPTP